MNDQFYEGLEVYYHKQAGVVQFICDSIPLNLHRIYHS